MLSASTISCELLSPCCSPHSCSFRGFVVIPLVDIQNTHLGMTSWFELNARGKEKVTGSIQLRFDIEGLEVVDVERSEVMESAQ